MHEHQKIIGDEVKGNNSLPVLAVALPAWPSFLCTQHLLAGLPT